MHSTNGAWILKLTLVFVLLQIPILSLPIYKQQLILLLVQHDLAKELQLADSLVGRSRETRAESLLSVTINELGLEEGHDWETS